MPTPAMTPGRILVVDDQPANLRAVSALLTRHGYEVATAGNGDEALALATAQVPDLLLLDMMMPGMDGFELLAQLKQHPELRKLPAIFLTAAVGLPTLRLVRVAIGDWRLGTLPPGQWRVV